MVVATAWLWQLPYRLSIFNNLEEVVMDIGSVYEMDVEDI